MNLPEIFELARDKGASDVHLLVGKPPILRIDGNLLEVKNEPEVTEERVKKMISEILHPEQFERLQSEKDLDTSYELKDETRFRVNCHYEKGHLGLVARLVPATVPTLEEIGATEPIYEFARFHDGLVLVTGPTGHGKSTTLAGMVNLINEERGEHIVTLEDPIEFIFKPNNSIIKQRQLGIDMKSFDQGLKHVLRQDPNVIMVGEMRDLETVGAAITLAETGHLVIATLHTVNASQTVDRIIDIFPPHQQEQVRTQLSMTLRGIISQKLLPGLNGGRVAAREVLVNTPAVANMIRENKIAQIKTAIQTSADVGMITLDHDILRLYKEKAIDKETALSYLSDPGLLK